MGQVGLHALAGLLLGQQFLCGSGDERKRVEGRAFRMGFLLGNIAPDLDYLAVVSMYPIDQSLALDIHRGFSHSLFAAAAVAVGFMGASIIMNDKHVRYFGLGLALGVVAHFTMDIFLWFSPVDVFWPASVYGLIPPINLWYWWSTPPLVAKLLGAAEFAAFGLYYDQLERMAVALGSNLDVVPSLQRMAKACWVSWVFLSVLALFFPEATISVWFLVPTGILFMPACFYLTWRMQETIERMTILRQGSL